MVPIDRLARLAPACQVSRARVVDAGRVITAAGVTAGMEMGFHLLRRAGYDEAFIVATLAALSVTRPVPGAGR
jgi:transcriptional regulator GlxA family with amidase domain